MLPGRSASDSVFRTQVHAASLQTAGDTTAEINMDLEKAIDHVNWWKLQQAALALQFPTAILRLMLSVYMAPRLLVLQGDILSKALTPTRGSLAGSSFATLELAVLIIESLRQIQQQTPSCTLSVQAGSGLLRKG